ncbi:MAG: hypothetical protein DHS20C13_03740 [Thermodesulfobacteriota bacterium]|nr:MAG: hypothetical protein DHS20C13_03740 [Thermodesulfobacteriota bacterium]
MTKFIPVQDKSVITLFLSMALLLSGFLMLSNLASAQDTDTCADGTLNPGDGTQNLLITAPCDVGAGEYKYLNVNVINNGVLNFLDEGAETNFWAKSILVESGGSLKAGEKSAAGAFGANGGKLTIYLYGSKTDPDVECKSPQQTSGVPCGIDRDVWGTNTMSTINPTSCTKSTMPDKEMDCFYDYPDPQDSPEVGFFGSKVLAVSYNGTIQMYGSKGATYDNLSPSNSGTSWARLNMGRVINKGETSLTLDRDVDWDIDDYIVLTTTDYLPGHSEKLKITGKTGMRQFDFKVVDPHSNKDIPEGPGLQYPHNGDTYKLDKVPARVGLNIMAGGQPAVETRAAVGLLSRSIRVVSAGNSVGQEFGPPTPGNHFGGHLMVRQGVKSAEIQGVEFYQLGQGGIKGRYPVHMHLLRKSPGTIIKDNSIHDSMTRWITLHGTQGITLARNVGYMSIGHGYYLEDGTEINNKLQSNLGVLARAAVENDQNPRRVPGILAANTNPANINVLTAVSDYTNPTVFWLTNGWNDVEYNMAAGATACGACYWPVNAAISGPSRRQNWESYASIKPRPGRDATAPIKKFKGNYCTTAMNSYNATVSTTPCVGVGQGGSVQIKPVPNPLAPALNTSCTSDGKPNLTLDSCVQNEFYYPAFSANPNATRCAGTDCSGVAACSGANVDNCAVTVLDRYTTAFHWTETNFSAIWLRRAFFTVINSAITNVLNAGLTFVTGGDYTQSSLLPGSFMLAANNVFIGNTEKGNPFSSNAGPFSKSGLTCENPIQDNNYCLRINEGISMPLSNYGMNQRFFNIYDGPANQASNAYLDITKTQITDCSPSTNEANTCETSDWMYGRVLGVPRDVEEVIEGNLVKRVVKDNCVLPNAGIAWKQPNGFYYPPAFHSDNLFFDNVEIRHFVIQPLFDPGTFNTNLEAVKKNYCTYNPGSFTGWTAIDRQTILNDDDGSLTGVEKTISVNEDLFFTAPIEQFECRSEASAKTSPYEYVSTVVYPDCGVTCNQAEWSANCTSGCYGVPLLRQYLTGTEDLNSETEIRMQGPAIAGRINLTANNGLYYIDTTRNSVQQSFPLKNIFKANQTYYTFFIFAKPEIKQTYQFYVGVDPSISETDPQIVQATAADIATLNVGFDTIPGFDTWDDTGWDRQYDNSTGILTVTVDMANFKQNFDDAKIESCRPSSFCEPSGSSCKCSKTLMDEDPELFAECERIDICRWSGNDPDCPVFNVGTPTDPNFISRCLGFGITMPSVFVADDDMGHRPEPTPFPRAGWDVSWPKVGPTLAGQECYEFPTPPSNFGDGGSGNVGTTRNIIEGTAGPDKLRGTMGPDLIIGFGGDDEIKGRGGDDIIEGGPGDDTLSGNVGDDTIVGGPGNDLLLGGKGADNIDAGEGDDFVKGGRGNDDISGGDGNDVLIGQRGNDEIDGNSGDDVIEGKQGADDIDGGSGDDSILGGSGGDDIDGGPGDDMIEGGGGLDTCTDGESGSVCENE